jgi:hypothetical protein
MSTTRVNIRPCHIQAVESFADFEDWLKENVGVEGNEWKWEKAAYIFSNEEDAIVFKLTFNLH